MRRRAFVSIVALAALSGPPAVASAQEGMPVAIDPLKSSAQFSIQHIFVDRVTGTIPIVSGTVTLAPGSAIPLAVTATLEPGRMNTGDRDRDASLESSDYFDTKQFPTWTYTSTKITPTGPARFAMDGSLTMHGVTQPVALDVSVSGDASHPVYHAVAHVDRRLWEMKGTRLDPVIGTVADVTLNIALK